MAFEFRYSAHSGKWKTVETSIQAPPGVPDIKRGELGSGTIASGLEVASIRGINEQTIFLYDKVGHVYSTKVSADLKDIVPYPVVFNSADKHSTVYDIIVPFFILKSGTSNVAQYSAMPPSLGPGRTHYLLGYRRTGEVDIIELPSFTVFTVNQVTPGATRIEPLSLISKTNIEGKDVYAPFTHFLFVTGSDVSVWNYNSRDPTTPFSLVQSFGISGVTSTTSIVLLETPPARFFKPQDYQYEGFFLLTRNDQIEVLKVDSTVIQKVTQFDPIKLADSSFSLVGSFTPDSQKRTLLSLDSNKHTHFYEARATARSLELTPVGNAPTGFDEQQVSPFHITKFIGPNTGVRNRIVRGLIEASELEHVLMLQYIYAAMSLKTTVEEFTHPVRKYRQFELVRTWKQQIMMIASEEMRHLAYVQGLLISVSGASHFLRAELPNAHSYFPPGKTLMALQRFTPTTLARFIKFERPDTPDVNKHYEDIRGIVGTEFNLLFDDDVLEAQKWMPSGLKGKAASFSSSTPITPEDPHYTSIGQLYESLKHEIQDELLISTNEPLLNVSYIALLRRTMEAKNLNFFFPNSAENFKKIIDQIVKEGEGFDESDLDPRSNPHYKRFLNIMKEFAEEKRLDPDFDPARPVISNPALFPSRQVHLQAASTPSELFNPTYHSVLLSKDSTLLANHVISTKLVDLINVAYEAMLTWLTQVFSSSGPKNDYEAAATMTFFPYMSEIIMPLGDHLTEISASLVQVKDNAAKLHPKGLLDYQPAGDAPSIVAIGPSFDISEGAHLISIDKTARYVQIERFLSMKTLALEIVGLMEANPAIPKHIVDSLKYVAESFRLTALEFEYRTVYPTWPADTYMKYPDLDPFSEHVKNELGEFFDVTYPDDAPEKKRTPDQLLQAKLEEVYEKNFTGLKLSFSGWLNCRLGSDPDWSNHQTGLTGNSYAYCNDLIKNPPVTLDRVLRFNLPEADRSKYERSFGQKVEVKVSEVARFKNGTPENDSTAQSLKGAHVNLEKYKEQGPVYVGRNYLVAYDGEPIHPFILSLSSPDKFHVQRSAKQKHKGEEPNVTLEEMTPFERSLLGRWPYYITARPNEINLAAIGEQFPKKDNGEKFNNSVEYIEWKVAKLEQELASLQEFSAEHESVKFRLRDIKSHMYDKAGKPVMQPPLHIKWLRYMFYCCYCHHVTGPVSGSLPAEIGEVDDSDRWLVRYDAFVYDSDSLNHFIRGIIYIPLKE